MKSLVHALFAILIVITSVTNTSEISVAQEALGTSVRDSQLTGVTVDVGGSGVASFVDDLYYSTSYLDGMQEESFWIEIGNSEVAITFFTGEMALDQFSLDYVKNSQFAGHRHFAIIGAVNDVDRDWYVTEESLYSNQNFYGYHEFNWNAENAYYVLITIYAGKYSLTNDIAWMQSNVQIDGVPVLLEAEVQEIAAVVNGTSSVEPIAVPAFSSDVDDWSDQGLVSETEWHGDLIGNEYTWVGGTLRFPFEAQDAIMYLEPNKSSSLNLTTKDNTSNILVTELINDSRPEISDWTARWSSEEMLIQTNNIYPAIAIKESDSANGLIVRKVPKYDLELYTIRQGILMPDGGVVMITIVVDAEHAIDTYSLVTSDLKINGQNIPSIWSKEELKEYFPLPANSTHEPTHTNRTPSTDEDGRPVRLARGSDPEATSETASPDWANLGLVSDTEWHSPNSQTSFSWDGDLWTFPSDQAGAIQVDDVSTYLTLKTTTGNGEVILGTDVGGIPIEDWYAFLISDEWAELQAEDGQPFTLLDHYKDNTTASVILLHHTENGDLVVIIDVYENEEGVTLLTEISATLEDIAEVYTSVWDGVQANGDYYPLTWTIDDIESLEVG